MTSHLSICNTLINMTTLNHNKWMGVGGIFKGDFSHLILGQGVILNKAIVIYISKDA